MYESINIFYYVKECVMIDHHHNKRRECVLYCGCVNIAASLFCKRKMHYAKRKKKEKEREMVTAYKSHFQEKIMMSFFSPKYDDDEEKWFFFAVNLRVY